MTLIMMLTDAYKLFHRRMYPANTVRVYSNNTFRSMKHYPGKNKKYGIVFGNQKLVIDLKDKFDEFFAMDWPVVAEFLKTQLDSFTGTDYEIEHIKYLHSLQYLPMVFKSLPEGTKCPVGVPNLTFYNTDEKCFWLTNFLETWLSNNGWQGHFSATMSNEYREILEHWAMKTTGSIENVPIQGHDFSMRGMGGSDVALASGMGHLTSFVGTDTVPAYLGMQYYYDSGINRWADLATQGWMNAIVGTSVPATEHSVQCAHWNEKAMTEAGHTDELEYLDYILAKFPTGIVSIVCDGFDFWTFITITLPKRKSVIMARDGKVVVRPDSGNPADIICGISGYNTYDAYYKMEYAQPTERGIADVNEYKGAVECLWDIFGGTTNDLGYKELDSHIGLIYGDSITLDLCNEICSKLTDKEFASTNWVAGIGSFTFRFATRDSMGGAYKATHIQLEEEIYHGAPTTPYTAIVGKNIFKDPKTGDGTKKSAKGLLRVYEDKVGTLVLQNEVSEEDERTGELKIIFQDGELYNQTNLFEIRNRITNREN